MNASPPYSLPTFEAEEHPCPFCEDDAMFSIRHAHYSHWHDGNAVGRISRTHSVYEECDVSQCQAQASFRNAKGGCLCDFVNVTGNATRRKVKSAGASVTVSITGSAYNRRAKTFASLGWSGIVGRCGA